MIGRAVGNYVVLERVGSGGMGTVYLAEHPRIKRRVAIKVLRSELADDAEAVSRFFTEAKSANEIHNEHIIEILDFGEFEDGAPYLIMEWLEGSTLTQYLTLNPRPTLDRVVHILAGIGDALDAAHARSIVHRDLKPDNIFIVPRALDANFVKVLDFGIAKLLHQRSSAFKTRTNTIVGTPAYMSPEQCRSAHEQVDGRSDIYSLGIIAYQMITGRIPFDAPSALGMIGAHAAQPPPPLRSIDPAIPEAVEAAVLRALEKVPDQRFQNAAEMVTAIAAGAGVSLMNSWRYTLPPVSTTPSRGTTADPSMWQANTVETPMPSPLIPPSATPSTMNTPGKGQPPHAPETPDTLGSAASEVMPPPVTRTIRRRLAFGSAVLGLVLVIGTAVTVGFVRRPAGSEATQPAASANTPAARPPAEPSPAAVSPLPAPAAVPPPSVPSPAPAVPASAPPAAEADANRVMVEIRSEPAGADIFLDEAPLSNPFSGAFGRSDVRHRLVVKAHGYHSSSTWEVFDRDRSVVVKLRPSSGAAPRAAAIERPAPAPAKPAAQPAAPPAAPPARPDNMRSRPHAHRRSPHAGVGSGDAAKARPQVMC